jgi:hypothetical protein
MTALLREGKEPFFTNPEDREAYGELLDVQEIISDDNGKLYALSLPDGFFEDTTVGIRFSVKGYAGNNGVNGAMEDSFMLYRDSVVTIVGSEGDFWQNPFLNPDGTPAEIHRQEVERELAMMDIAASGIPGNI